MESMRSGMRMRARTRGGRIARLVLFVLPAVLLLFAGMVWVVMSLWNGLMPAIFSVKTVSYWQALGLMVLCWILFGGFRGARSRRGHWDHGMRRRWQRMTSAEREEFIQGLRSRWEAGASGHARPEPPPGPRS